MNKQEADKDSCALE